MTTHNDLHRRIEDYYEDPYHRGQSDRPTHRAEARHDDCGDVVAIELGIDNEGTIRDAWFDGDGCRLSQAIASMLVEHVEGQSAEVVAELTIDSMLCALNATDIEADKIGCCQLALSTVQSAIQNPLDDAMDGPTFSGPDLGDEC